MSQNEEERKEDNSPMAVLVFGKTGSGKSTLITIFCPNVNESIIRHGSESGTKGFHSYSETEGKIWVDTMGTDDSEGNMIDKDILRQVMFGLNKTYPEGLEIKVVWLSVKSPRADNGLKTQAQFINSLSKVSDNSNLNVWNSTLIIVKEGTLNPLKDANGPKRAAAIHNAPTLNNIRDIDNNLLGDIKSIGYTFIEKLDDNNPYKLLINDISKERRFSLGLLYKNEIKEKISQQLSSLNPIKIKFKNSKCKKCGVEGDERYVPSKCHTIMKEIHPERNKLIHTGILIWKHPSNSFNRYHNGSISKYHPGYRTTASNGTSTYTDGHKILCGRGHSGVFTDSHVTSGTFNCHGGDKLHIGEDIYECAVCPRNNQNATYKQTQYYTKGIWCSAHIKKEPITKTREESKDVHSCCKWDYGTTGCTEKMTCCTGSPGSLGCKKSYTCCGNAPGSRGCKQFWSCCNTLKTDNRPCSYACCKQNIYSAAPCKKICQSCQKEWGVTEGCGTENRKHDM